MQDDLIKSDSNQKNNTHTNQDASNNQTQVKTDLEYPYVICFSYNYDTKIHFFRVDPKSQLNSEFSGKIIDNFDYTTSDVIFWEQPPPYSQLSVSIFPTKHHYAKNRIIISRISNPRNFFLISSIIYFIWGVIAFALTIALTIISYTIPYFTLWSVFLILNGAIDIYLIQLWSSNDINHLKRMFSFTLFLNTMGFILSVVIINSTTSIVCLNTFNFLCDNNLATYLQLVFVLVFIVSTIHNIFNVVIVYNIDNGKMLKTLPSAV